MVRKEYSAVRKTEVRGFFVSLLSVVLVLLLFLSLLIAHKKGKAKHFGAINGDLNENGKPSY